MTKSFFEIATEAESIDIRLDDVRQLVALFSDHLGAEVENLKEGPGMVVHFFARFPMATALLGAIEKGLTDISKDILALSEQATLSHKASKGGKM